VESDLYSNIKQFYRQPAIQLSRKNRAKPSLYSQLIQRKPKQDNRKQLPSHQATLKSSKPQGHYDLLNQLDEVEEELTIMQNENNESQAMEEDPPVEREKQGAKTNKSSKTKVMKTWEGDTTISQLSATFVTNLQVEQEKLQEAGEDTEETKYKLPTDATEIKQQNRIRFSLRKVRNAESQPMLKLFKSYVKALRECDPSIAILPVNASKQNLPPLSNAAMVNATDINKLQIYFKSYYPNQKTNLSGYINVLTVLDFAELDIAPSVYEWLESNRYTMRECLSQDEEMIQIGALCFGSEFIYREDLKKALEMDPAWKFPNLEKAPVIQLT
jgi:hypothetical protein